MSSQYLFLLFLFSASPYLLNLPHLGAGPPVGEDEGGEGGGEDDHEAAHEHVGGGCLHPGGRAQRPGSRGLAQPLAGGCREDRRLAGVSRAKLLISAVNDKSAKLYNHGEGPYYGLLLVESAY